MDIVYVLLLLLAGASFLLQIEWLLLAAIFMFFALIMARYYSSYSGSSSSEENSPAMTNSEGASFPGPQQQSPAPIIVLQGGGSNNAATITDNMISTMMGNLMAMDVYEKEDTPRISGFLQRGRRMRQGFFDHQGKYGAKHKAMDKQHSNQFYEKLDSIDKKLGKLGV
ncbi:MAG: hypothetical protein AABX01_03725 [Candidatus Micrarchaeota archaeon]